jgi:hypothetical protein
LRKVTPSKLIAMSKPTVIAFMGMSGFMIGDLSQPIPDKQVSNRNRMSSFGDDNAGSDIPTLTKMKLHWPNPLKG